MPPTPKFKSSAFKTALAQLKGVFDAHSLGVVLLDALERRAAEQIFGKVARGGGRGRLSNVPKTELVGQITGWFFSSNEVAYQVMKEMDRACAKERHIVSSIPEGQAPERIGSYRAISFKRERAKLVWALARDDRSSVSQLANRVINEFFHEVADLEKARAITEEGGQGIQDDVELARRLQAQAEQLSEATEKVTDLETQLTGFEKERARLLVEMGTKERLLKRESQAREELEGQLGELRDRLEDVESEQAEAERARQSEAEARQVAEDLAQKVRRLEKLAGAADALSEAQDALEQERKKNEDLVRQHAREIAAYTKERSELDKDRGRLRAELETSRQDLKRARKQIEELQRPADAAEERSATEPRLAILLDQANLAGVATQNFGRKVNFSALLDRLRAGRKLGRAVAFVVDKGGAHFDAFCDTLRRSGWELRLKKPKRFSDGTTKADWDMGMAMEAIDLRGQAEIVVLVTGDGDFAPLVKRLQRWNMTVEVAAFPEGLAGELAQVADSVTRLDRSTLE